MIRRLLPPLQVLSSLCLLVAALQTALVEPVTGFRLGVAVIYGAAFLVAGVLWLLRARRRPGRVRAVLSAAVALAMLPIALLGPMNFTIPVLLLAVALVVVDIGRRTGWAAATVMLLAGAVLHLITGSGALLTLANTLAMAALLGFGIFLGSALRAYEDAHVHDRRIIAERDRALAEREEALERLRRSAEVEKELLLADERARSARELHDGLGHRLTLISMSLEFARRTHRHDPEAAWEEVAVADTTTREALAEMRTWVRALSPVRDASATGAAAVEAIAESFRGTGLEVTVDAVDPVPALGADASLLLYRTVQEGLTNALRHGHAETVRITLTRDGAEVVMRLCSDLDAAARASVPVGAAEPGFGLRGVTDRSRDLAGTTRAERVGDHFVLEVRLPADRALDPAGPRSAPPPSQPPQSAVPVTGP